MPETRDRILMPIRNELHFTKMNGAGNDFVILDLRLYSDISAKDCLTLSDRHTGVGCDMILGILSPRDPRATVAFRIWCADGSISMQCGNGARCIAGWALREGLACSPEFMIESPSGLHSVEVLPCGNICVSMGCPDFSPESLPMQGYPAEKDIYETDLSNGNKVQFSALSVGNPHAVILVEDVARADVYATGTALQHSACLPEQVNVGFAQILSRTAIKLRVFEFGAGETLACGSGACAAAAALIKQGLLDREVSVYLPGGEISISWESNNSAIYMAGPAEYSFKGSIPYAALQ